MIALCHHRQSCSLSNSYCSVDEGEKYRVDSDVIKSRGILLNKYLDHSAKLELHALYALQLLMHRLQHPPSKSLCRTVMCMLFLVGYPRSPQPGTPPSKMAHIGLTCVKRNSIKVK